MAVEVVPKQTGIVLTILVLWWWPQERAPLSNHFLPRGATAPWILLGRWPVFPLKPPVTEAAPRRVGAGMGKLPFDVAGAQPFHHPGGEKRGRSRGAVGTAFLVLPPS